MDEKELLLIFCVAIARFEGFFKTKSLARRNNNPGNLRSWGKTPVKNGFAVFTTEAEGWRALRIQCRKNIIDRELTFKEFFGGKPGVYSGYAPAHENDTGAYAKFVAEVFGIKDTSKRIKDIITDASKEN